MATQTQPKPPGTASTSSLGPGEMICPDPSAHGTQSKQLQEQASTAALYVTNPNTARPGGNAAQKDNDSRLSSASAATSLKHAKAHELPSFPVVGIDTQTSAETAAHLASANQKPFEHWKPDASDSAGKAAYLAKDFKPPTKWEPEASSAGSKAALLAHKESTKDTTRRSTQTQENKSAGSRAALLAHKDASNIVQRATQPPDGSAAGSRAALLAHQDSTRRVTPPPVESTEAGNSAAGAAMRPKSQSPSNAVESRADSQRKALLAATGAFKPRKRSESTPNPVPLYPDAVNSGYNALNAATIAHKPSTRSTRRPESSSASKAIPQSALDAARIQNVGKNVSREMWTDSPPVSIEVEEKKHKEALRGASISMAKNLYDAQTKLNEEAAELSRSRSVGQAAAATSVQEQRPSSMTSEELKDQALRYIHVQDAARKLAAERLSKIMPNEEAAFRQYYGYGSSNRRSRLSIRSWNHRRASSEGSHMDSDDDEERSRRIHSQMNRFNEQLALVDEKKRQRDRQSLMAAAEKLVNARMQTMDEKVFAETGKVPPAMMEEWEVKAREKAAAESEARMVNHGKVHVGGGKFLDQADIDAVAAAKIQPTLDQISDQAEKQRARDEEIRLDMEERKRQAQMDKDREAGLKAEEKRIKDEEKLEQRQKKEEEKNAQRQEKEAEKARKAEEKRVQKEEKRKSKEMRRTYISEQREASVEREDIGEGEEQRAEYTVGVVADPENNDMDSPTSPNRFKSLVSKFKRKSKQTSPKDDADQAASSSAAGGAEEAGEPSPRSPSISSLSSSDSEPERGRTKSSASGVSESKEEQRDLVDEALMPSPPFASKTKEDSPARQPRFHEEL